MKSEACKLIRAEEQRVHECLMFGGAFCFHLFQQRVDQTVSSERGRCVVEEGPDGCRLCVFECENVCVRGRLGGGEYYRTLWCVSTLLKLLAPCCPGDFSGFLPQLRQALFRLIARRRSTDLLQLTRGYSKPQNWTWSRTERRQTYQGALTRGLLFPGPQST